MLAIHCRNGSCRYIRAHCQSNVCWPLKHKKNIAEILISNYDGAQWFFLGCNKDSNCGYNFNFGQCVVPMYKRFRKESEIQPNILVYLLLPTVNRTSGVGPMDWGGGGGKSTDAKNGRRFLQYYLNIRQQLKYKREHWI